MVPKKAANLTTYAVSQENLTSNFFEEIQLKQDNTATEDG